MSVSEANCCFSVAGHWVGGFDDRGLQEWAAQLRSELKSGKADLGLVFMSPAYFDRAGEILEILQVHAQVPMLVGCSCGGRIAGGQEYEESEGLVLGLYHLPGASLHGIHFTQEQVQRADGPQFWQAETGVESKQNQGWLVFMDPFHLDGETWLEQWNEAYAPSPILGGVASGDPSEARAQVYLNGQVWEEGGVALSVGGDVRLVAAVSQGCTPVGEAWTITRAEGNYIMEIGTRPALQVLMETFQGLPDDLKKRAQGNILVGLVIDEYQEEFHRGDFLIRNLLGGDPKSGVLAVGAHPRVGQSFQFQCRDAAAATEDLGLLLERVQAELKDRRILGGCLCACNGRGERLFGESSHDAKMVQKTFGPMGLAGFFCNGELGPVGSRSFLHGYTASLALFVEK